MFCKRPVQKSILDKGTYFRDQSLYTQTPLYTEAFTQKNVTQKTFAEKVFWQSNLYRSKPLHTETFTHRLRYTEKRFHKETYACSRGWVHGSEWGNVSFFVMCWHASMYLDLLHCSYSNCIFRTFHCIELIKVCGWGIVSKERPFYWDWFLYVNYFLSLFYVVLHLGWAHRVRNKLVFVSADNNNGFWQHV